MKERRNTDRYLRYLTGKRKVTGISMKPMLKYRGGKNREIPELLRFVPTEYARYVEPFFGGGALYFYLEPKCAIINDLNKGLMDFYRGVRDDWATLHDELSQLQAAYERNRADFERLKASSPEVRVPDKNEDEYYRLRDMFNGLREPEYSWAALYYYINKTAYSGMIRYNKNGEYNVPYGRYKHLNGDLVTLQHSELLKRAELFSGDYQAIFDICREDDFVFLDPPYDCVFSDYGNPELGGGFSAAEHRRLADSFFKLPCYSLLVIGKTDLTMELYGDFVVHEYEKSYAVNIRNRFKSESKHILVTNGR